jgi:hypothetical protein
VRYCHFVDEEEQAVIVRGAGMPIQETFLEDGSDRDFNRYVLFARSGG